MTQRAVSLKDAVLYLIALPLAILLCIGLLRWTFAAQRNSASSQFNQPTESALPFPPPEMESDASERSPRLPILGAWAITSLATNGDDFLNNLNERRKRPIPDELLTDEQGFPVLSGRVEHLDTSFVSHQLLHTASILALKNSLFPAEARDALLRTLALLECILEQVAYDWPLSPIDTIDSAADHIPTLGGILSPVAGSAKELSLRVKLLISEELELHERDAVQDYLAKRLTAYKIPAPQLKIDVIAAGENISAIMLAEEFRIEALDESRSESPQALLLLAAFSALCTTITDRWGVEGRLFDSRRPNGLMPGEAAFAVLCANEKALESASAAPICYMGRVIHAQRETNAATKTSSECLVSTIGAALDATDISGDAIGAVVCDADHRTSRTLESIEAMLSQTPRLDAIQNRFAINEACGHLGAASVLGVLATGVIQSGNTDRPVLLFNVSHPTERVAAILTHANSHDAASRSQQLQAA
ncbi:MAG TPA: hypothetical protein VJ654_18770 [Noviherbaspirillum sp.]|nr:hypothetical protein [Noviherbaspirillum sp.]